ncbi:type VII toxin-antitoxin system HepT family RNase toxin [Ureibacillus composti]
MKKEDFISSKVKSIEKCVKRVREVYDEDLMNLIDQTKQDSIILNMQRISETSVELALFVVTEKLSEQATTRSEALEVLGEKKILPIELVTVLKTITNGFKHIALYDYESINLDILKSIVNRYLDNFSTFTKLISEYENEGAVSQE